MSEIIQKTLETHLRDFGKDNKYVHENAISENKTICDEIKNKLKDEQMNLKRYKILVHCIIGMGYI